MRVGIGLPLLLASAAASSGGYLRSGSHRIWHNVIRPELLRDPDARSPLVVAHGGPQVPSDYLFDLADVDDERAVVFYDQLGCGRSDEPPADSGAYSVARSVDDLRSVLRGLGLDETPHHLYGQSWGGLLAFSHLTRGEDRSWAGRARSLTLHSTPSSVPVVEAEANRLVDECGGDVATFMARHNYRGGPGEAREAGAAAPMPAQLAAAYAHAGTTWRGSAAIEGLEARAEAMGLVERPVLVLRGEHDFCTEACVEGWRGLREVSFVTVDGASHHTLLEAPEPTLEALRGFLRAHDAREDS
jgi:pimeloyl-ACP methyl ester carboxylesterase